METAAKSPVPALHTATTSTPQKTPAKSTPVKPTKEKIKKAVLSSPKPKPTPSPTKKLKVGAVDAISSPTVRSPATKRRISLEEPTLPEAEPQEIIIKPPPQKRTKIDAAGTHSSTCDPYCWVCHKEGTTLDCQVCPRAFHVKCEGGTTLPTAEWICPECRLTMAAENVDTRSTAMSMLSIEQLCSLLKFALARLKKQSCEAFHKPVSIEEYPTYLDYIVHPVDILLLEKNIKGKLYGSTEAFVADVKWMYHNSVIFNGSSHRLTSYVRNLVKVCKAEMKEIETCPDCYLHAHTVKENWFVEPCRKPHVLVWAKLKGFPYWPGKVVKVENGNADVRFFGAHDKAWVPVHLCFLLSYNTPQPIKVKKKANFDQSLEELDAHIQKLKQKLGGFEYALPKTPLDPEKVHLQALSKVTTGRRYSDADSSLRAPKARTFTVVTSSWTRKQQAEGFTKQKDKLKPEFPVAVPSFSAPPPSRMSATIKSEPIDTTSSNEEMEKHFRMFGVPQIKKNPPPKGVFEISDSSLGIPAPVAVRSSKLGINKYQNMSWKSLIDRISEQIDDQVDDGEAQISITYSDDSDEEKEKSEDSKDGAKKLSSEEDSQTAADPVPVESPVEKPKEVEKEVPKDEEPEKPTFRAPKVQGTGYLPKLEETIKQCKAQLGITGSVSEDISFETSEDEDEEEDEEEALTTTNKDESVQNSVPDETETNDPAGDSEHTKLKTKMCNGQNASPTISSNATGGTEALTVEVKAKENTENDTQYSHKLLGFVEELSKDSEHPNNQQATIRSLELEIERLLWTHKQELLEVKHNSDLVLLEVRASLEAERQRAIAELQDRFTQELIEQKKILLDEKRKSSSDNERKNPWKSCSALLT